MTGQSVGGAPSWPRLGRALASALCVVAAAAMVELAGCGDSAAPGGGGSGGSGGSPSATFADSECGSCVVDACADAFAECKSTPDCAAYLDCLLACPLDDLGNADPACDEGCTPASESSEGLNGRVAVTSCREDGAAADCADCVVEQPPPQVCEEVVQAMPCPQCYSDKCCETRDACQGSSPDCQALFECTIPCGDLALTEPCLAECLAEHPDSVDAFVAERQCALIVCANEQDSCDPDDRDECEACLYGTCSQPLNDLLATPEGYLTWWCSEDCADAEADGECFAACSDKYPDYKEAFLLWGECIGYWCTTSCKE